MPSCGEETTDTTEDKPTRNVILFVVDTLRADRLSCYGYPRSTSPNIDRWAKTGTLFSENRAQGCWTVPSMISMMSGYYVFGREESLPESPSMPERLQAEGMVTLAAVANGTLCGDRGFQRGFDDFVDCSNKTKHASKTLSAFTDSFTAHRDEIRNGPGFFGWIHLMDPHGPYTPADEDAIFRRQPLPEGSEYLESLWEEHADHEGDETPFSLAAQRMNAYMNRYDGEIVAVDRAFQDLLDFLKSEGELERTLIIFASDHGEMLYDKPHYPKELEAFDDGKWGVMGRLITGHGRGWFYDGIWKTPLIIAGPGIPEGGEVETLAANLDIYPTVLDALGLREPPGLHGQSVHGGARPERSFVFGSSFNTTALLRDDFTKAISHPPNRFLEKRSGGQRIVEYVDVRDGARDESIPSPSDDTVSAFEEAFSEWRSRFPRPAANSTLSSRDHQTLIEMGYIGGRAKPRKDSGRSNE